MNVQEQKEMCTALQKIINMATKTIKELGETFALLSKKLEEENKNKLT